MPPQSASTSHSSGSPTRGKKAQRPPACHVSRRATPPSNASQTVASMIRDRRGVGHTVGLPRCTMVKKRHSTVLTRASTRWHSCGCLCALYGRLVDEVDGNYTEPLVRTMLCIFCGVQYRWIDMERGCVDTFHGVAACAAVSSRRNWIGAQCKGGRLKCIMGAATPSATGGIVRCRRASASP